MRKKISLLFTGLSLMLMTFIPFQASAGWIYKSDVTLDVMDGVLYLRTDCGTFEGDDCNVPGSSFRVAFSTIWSIIRR